MVFYLDNCSDQNKSKFVLTFSVYAMFKLNIRSIRNKYFVTGHNQNESDSVHATIQKEIRNYKNQAAFP